MMNLSQQVHPRVRLYAEHSANKAFADFNIPNPIPEPNLFSVLPTPNRKKRLDSLSALPCLFLLKRSFFNPFNCTLFVLGLVSFFAHRRLNDGSDYNTTGFLLFFMLFFSALLRFTQELKAEKAVRRINKQQNSCLPVLRRNVWQTIPNSALKTGDVIFLKAGDTVPADCRLLQSENFYVSESSLTGESGMKEKNADSAANAADKGFSLYRNTLFRGSIVLGGKAKALVLALGRESVYGQIPLAQNLKKFAFDSGAKAIAKVFASFMAVLVPLVFLFSGIAHGNWLLAFLFSLSVSVGLVPEMLPMVITTCLAKGSSAIFKKKTLIKNINAMHTLGSMDILCLDKTGTLTKNELILEYYTDILGNENQKVLDYVYLNAYFHSGIDNPLDRAVLKISEYKKQKEYCEKLRGQYKKLSEIPFSHTDKTAGILVRHGGENIILAKGSVKEVYKLCSQYEYNGKTGKIQDSDYASVENIVGEMQEEGMKVIAVAYKKVPDTVLCQDMMHDFTLLGYAAFFDSPKPDAKNAIQILKNLHIQPKILTGDSKDAALSVCRRLDIGTEHCMTGKEFAELSEDEKIFSAEKSAVFAELSPKQKAEIVAILQNSGHVVGFLGDAVNDIPAIMQANVGITPESAGKAVQESAEVILLQNNLLTLESAVYEGRKVFVNMAKYLRITASSNFGNILSIVFASLFLPFLPMAALQILLLNLLYDTLCLVLPWDNADKEQLAYPKTWNSGNLGYFMRYFGGISSLFDGITFVFLYCWLCPALLGNTYFQLNAAEREQFVLLFQTGWFLESLWTQVFILQLLRSPKIPFFQSTSSFPVLSVTLAGLTVLTGLTFAPYASFFQLTALPPVYFVFLFLTVFGYLFCISLAKHFYLKKHAELI